MAQKVIKTASGTVGLGAYVEAWKRVKAAPVGAEYKSSLCGRWSATREEILRQFSDGLHDRINRHVPWFGKGRRWSEDWQRAVRHTARMVNTPRLIIHGMSVPREFHVRLAHRFFDED